MARRWREGRQAPPRAASAGRTFESIGDEWIAGVDAGRIGRRKGRGKPYTATTVADYTQVLPQLPPSGVRPFPADDIGEVEWQMWVDRLSREGLSRSRITTHVAVASAIYAWAMVPSRRMAERNPLRLVELPPSDEKPRLRVAFAPEAEQLLDALDATRRGALRDCVLRGAPPRRDRPTRMAGGARGQADRLRGSSSRARRARPAANGDRRSPSRCAESSGRPGSGGAADDRKRARDLGDVRQARDARDHGWSAPGCSGSRCTSAGTPTPRC